MRARSTSCSPTRPVGPTSMRASPEYRLAMLRVLAVRAVATAIERLAGAAAS